MAPVEHARSGDENGAAVAALAQMRTVTAIVAVAGRPRREGGRAGLLGRPRRRARVGCSGIQGSQVPTHRHCGRVRQPGSYVGACSRRCVEVHNGGECGGCWRKRVGRGSVSVIVEGGVGGAGVLAPPTGAGCGVRFGRPSWRWRARAADGGWLYSEGSIRSGRFHLIGNKQCGGIGASRPRQHGLCVAWHLPSGTIGARSNAKPAPGTRRAASCDVRECCTAAPGGFKHGRLACPASDGRVSGARQARAARVPWV